MTIPVLTIVTTALTALNVYRTGASITPADGEECLGALNTILDDCNASRQAVWAAVFTIWPLTPGLSPHTIGPTGTWVVPERPVSIDGAALVVGTDQYSSIGVSMDPTWWAARSSPTVGGMPTSLYYAPSEPNGEVYFVGTPTAVGSIRLQTRSVFTTVALTDSLVIPQGYRSAITLTLMEAVAETFGRAVSASLEKRAGKARARIAGNNLVVPTLTTRGLGVPGGTGGRWNYLTGTVE